MALQLVVDTTPPRSKWDQQREIAGGQDNKAGDEGAPVTSVPSVGT
jgi:hypothetical protein